jgi:hypothetical protein
MNSPRHEQARWVHRTQHPHLPHPHHLHLSFSMTTQQQNLHVLAAHLSPHRPHPRANDDHRCCLTSGHTHDRLHRRRCASSSRCHNHLRVNDGSRSRRLHRCRRCFQTGHPFHLMPMILFEILHLRVQVSRRHHGHHRNLLQCFSIGLFWEACRLV